MLGKYRTILMCYDKLSNIRVKRETLDMDPIVFQYWLQFLLAVGP